MEIKIVIFYEYNKSLNLSITPNPSNSINLLKYDRPFQLKYNRSDFERQESDYRIRL